MKALKRLFGHYVAYHEHGPLMQRYMGLLGLVGFPLLYLVRFIRPQVGYDDLPVRLFDAALCGILLLRDRWPRKLKPYYLAYSYVVVIVALPMTFAFTSLKNGGGVAAVSNTLTATFLVILLTDWRNTLVVLLTGFGLGALLYIGTEAVPRMPVDYLARLPIFVLVVVAGSLFKFALESATAQKVRNAYASLAGSIAHEMRTPLGQLKHSLEGIQQALPAPTTTGHPQTLDAHAVNALYRHLAHGEMAVARGLQVISMTLDEVNAKRMDPAGFSLLSAAEVARKAVQEYSYDGPRARDSVDVEVVKDFSFRGDETAYLFVLFNLIKNAVYYLPLHPQMRVTVTVRPHEVEVTDTGPGMPPEMLEGLFEPFRSVGKSDGTGLGLAYCRRVMLAFGGEIGGESVQGEYTRFTMRFPPVGAAEVEAHRAALLVQHRAALTGKRLLIVEDDGAQRLTTRHKLRPLVMAVDEAPDGQRALEMLARKPYDLVLLDLNMPVLDGYAVAERLRHGWVPLNRDVAIVAYTSEPAQLAGVKVKNAGMDGFVRKPSDVLPLAAALCQALAHRRHTDRDIALLAGRQVILADDSTFNRKAAAAHLRNAGATVQEVEHGAAVLEQLRALGGADAVLVDINMPGMSGPETAQAIRLSGEPWAGVPIIALTAHAEAGSVQAARIAGMNGYLVKPVDLTLLCQTLQPLLEPGSQSQPGSEAAAAETPGEEVTPLLNGHRLEGYRRLGMLEELLGDYLPEIARLVRELEQASVCQDLQATQQALHSLLGMSGEAGAIGLHQLVRRIYVPMIEQDRWPPVADWLERIRAVAASTDKALRDYGALEQGAANVS